MKYKAESADLEPPIHQHLLSTYGTYSAPTAPQEIRIKPPRHLIRNKINEDEICNLEELYDRPLYDQPLYDQPLDYDALNIKMDTMQLMADSSSLKASNILVPLTNDDRIISDKSPLKTNYPTTTNIFVSSDNVLMSNVSMEENHPHDDDSEDYLTKLQEENEERMKEYNDKIQYFEKKINKARKQIEELDRAMKNVLIEKEEKQQEFLNILNEYARVSKTDKSHEKGQKKNIKRIQGGIGGGIRK